MVMAWQKGGTRWMVCSFKRGSNDPGYICHAMMRYTATRPQHMELEIPPSSFVIFSTPGCIYVAMSRIAPLNARSTPTQRPPTLCNYRTQRDLLSGPAANMRRRLSSTWTPWVTLTRAGEAGHGHRRGRQRAAHGPRTGMVPCIIAMHRTWCGCRSEVWFAHAVLDVPGVLLPPNIWRRLGSHRSDERRRNGAASAAPSMFHRIKVNQF